MYCSALGNAHDFRCGDSARNGHGVLDVQLQGAHRELGVVCGRVGAVNAICPHRHHGRFFLLLRRKVVLIFYIFVGEGGSNTTI